MEETITEYTQQQLERYNNMVYKQNIIDQDASTISKYTTLLNWCNTNKRLLWDFLPFSFEQYAISHKVVL